MHEVDQAVVEWRRQMTHAGIMTPEILDELESHLREDVEREMASGVDASQAIRAAIQRLGAPGLLRVEFGKTERNTMKRVFSIGAGIVGVLVGMGFVMPAVALYHREGVLAGADIALLLLGSALTLGGLAMAVSRIRRRTT